MAIHQWPSSERPREKLLTFGAEALTDCELLALFLRTGHAGCSAVDLARTLLDHFGSLNRLLNAEYTAFECLSGIGPAKFSQMMAARELSRRSISAELAELPVMDSPEATREFFRLWIQDRPNECFACMFLDARHQVLRCEILFHGTIDGASVYPRVIVQRCLQLNAAALIIAHNHPSGVAEPSHADQHITVKIKHALALIDIPLLDHLVIGSLGVVSFAEQGLL